MILNKIEALVNKIPSKDKTSSRPVKELLSKDDLIDFERLRQRQIILMDTSYIESKRMRDMRLFRKLVILAEKDVKWPEIPPKDHPDFTAYAALTSARLFLGDKVEAEIRQVHACDIESSLQLLEKEAIDRGNAMDSKPWREFQQLQAKLEDKYKTKDIDPNKLSAKDQKQVTDAYEKIKPITRLFELAKDYEIIKALVSASQLIYMYDKEDMLTYGADDTTKIGSTVMKKANSGEFGEAIKRAHAFMRVINEQIPCDDEIEVKKLSDMRSKKHDK